MLLTTFLIAAALGSLLNASFSSDSVWAQLSDESSRSTRDVGGYGSGYGFAGGCPMCPHQQQCDTGSDMLLYFSAGALLGLLFSMMQNGGMMAMTPPAMMMMMPPPPPPPPPPMMGKQYNDGSPSEEKDDFHSSGSTQKRTVSSTNSFMTLIANDIAPLAANLMSVYARSQERPECARRLLCDLMQSIDHSNTANNGQSDVGSLRARLTSLSSVVLSWILLKDVEPKLGILDQLITFDWPAVEEAEGLSEDEGARHRAQRLVNCDSLSTYSSTIDCDELSSTYGYKLLRPAMSFRSTAVPGYND